MSFYHRFPKAFLNDCLVINCIDRSLVSISAFHFGKTDFELGVGGEGQDTSRHFEGIFGAISAILPTSGLGENSVLKGIELSYCRANFGF